MPGIAFKNAPARNISHVNIVPVMPAENQAADQHRDVHWPEHFSDYRNLADEERQNQANCKEHTRKDYFFHFFHLLDSSLCFFLESVYHSSIL